MYTEVVIHSMNAYVWCWNKICCSLDGMNSNMTLIVLNLHQKTDSKVQQDFKGQGHYGQVKGQIKVTP